MCIRDSYIWSYIKLIETGAIKSGDKINIVVPTGNFGNILACLLYTSDAADDLLCVDLGGRRIIKKKKNRAHSASQVEQECKTTRYYS